MNNYRNRVESGEITEIVLDTGVLITYFSNVKTPSTKWLDTYIFSDTSPVMLYLSEVQRAELFYILRRHTSEDEAVSLFEKRIIPVFTFVIDEKIGYMAGRIKWKYSIALTDCFCIATAIALQCPCIFLQETELPPKKVQALENEFDTQFILFDR